MRIFVACLVKNEEDVIEQSLLAATQWADKIFVYDNASTDRTLERIKAVAAVNDKVVLWKSDDKHYKNNLFGDIFNNYRHESKEGDWWAWYPADEFYLDDPREFLAKVPKRYHVVKCQSFNYQLTHEDLEEFELKDGEVFIRERLKYYKGDTVTEKRFFRYRKRLEWPAGAMHPKHIGVVYPKKIRLKHYQHRSPYQLQMRLDTRRELVATGYKFFKHAAQTDWKEKLYYRKDLFKDEGNNDLKFIDIKHDLKTNLFVDFIRMILHTLRIFA